MTTRLKLPIDMFYLAHILVKYVGHIFPQIIVVSVFHHSIIPDLI